jgi:cob(I)alamin adenosyltransferase
VPVTTGAHRWATARGCTKFHVRVAAHGSAAAAHLQHARTVVRRAERTMTEIAYQESVNPAALKYANRPSDLLFVLARHTNGKGRADRLWQPGLHR